VFMNNKLCFESPHSRDFMNLNKDVYCAPPYHNFSPCENLKFNECYNPSLGLMTKAKACEVTDQE